MNDNYNYAFLDEGSKREIRRSVLKAVAIPGYQVPFGSRELPIGRGWGTGGIQLTLSLIGPADTLKVIDQGSDESVNAVNITPCGMTRSWFCRSPSRNPCGLWNPKRKSPSGCTPKWTTPPSGSSFTRAW